MKHEYKIIRHTIKSTHSIDIYLQKELKDGWDQDGPITIVNEKFDVAAYVPLRRVKINNSCNVKK